MSAQAVKDANCGFDRLIDLACFDSAVAEHAGRTVGDTPMGNSAVRKTGAGKDKS